MAINYSLPKELANFINTEEWTFAKTMPKWSHEYLVRQKVDASLFLKLAAFISENVYEGRTTKVDNIIYAYLKKYIER
jgi:hypothetical protein